MLAVEDRCRKAVGEHVDGKRISRRLEGWFAIEDIEAVRHRSKYGVTPEVQLAGLTGSLQVERWSLDDHSQAQGQ